MINHHNYKTAEQRDTSGSSTTKEPIDLDPLSTCHDDMTESCLYRYINLKTAGFSVRHHTVQTTNELVWLHISQVP